MPLDGARTGAPDAIQVADRFHLWQNLAKAVERSVAAHRACLGEPEPGPAATPGPGPAAEPPPPPEPEPEPAGKFAERARRHHAMVHELLAQGHGMRTIARHLGWGRHTVQRYARAATWQELVDGRWQAPRASLLDPFKPHLHQRGEEGCSNVAELFREISALGYDGSYSTVRDYFDQYRPAAPLTPPPPTVREVTGWLTRHPDSLTEDEQPQLKALLERCPELQATSAHVRTFATMLTQLTGQNLPQWISGARASGLPGISSFAKGPGQDLDAVTQGLTSRWNSRPVEGRVNHIKMIKRQMFGRARLPLLRKRVLLTAQRQCQPRAWSSACSTVAVVIPSFHRWRRYGLYLSSLDARLVALTSSSPVLAAAAYRCTVFLLRPRIRAAVRSECPAASRPWTATWRSRVRATRRRSRPQTSRRPWVRRRRALPGAGRAAAVLGRAGRARQAAAVRSDRFLGVFTQVVPQMPAISDLDRLRCAVPGALCVAPARSRQITCAPGCAFSHVSRVPASRSGSSSIACPAAMSTRTVP